MSVGIQKIFTEVAPTYEWINHLLTFGMDTFWRNSIARIATSKNATLFLDVCSGTGELVTSLMNHTHQKIRIIASDISIPMISLAIHKNDPAQIDYFFADTKALPIRNNTFDVVTLSFATRNLKVQRGGLGQYFIEFHRVLKPSGHFINLETSQPRYKLLKILFHAYARIIIKRVGMFLSRSKLGYTFLSHTITQFHTAEKIAQLLEQAGFNTITYSLQIGGIIAIHSARKFVR